MNIEWKGSPNKYMYRMNTEGDIYNPEIHVIHICEGTLDGIDSWFASPKSDVSTHYCIGKKGEIHQYVSDEHGAWGNGICTNKEWFGNKLHPGVNPNMYTLSYELEGYSGDIPTEEQFNALIYIVNLKTEEYEIPRKREYFSGHFMIDPVNKSRCPGTGFPWTRFYEALKIDYPKSNSEMPVLCMGKKSDDVIFLQKTLQNKGYNVGNIDGIFGKVTLQAVKAFQSDNNLQIDGIVGPITWGTLLK